MVWKYRFLCNFSGESSLASHRVLKSSKKVLAFVSFLWYNTGDMNIKKSQTDAETVKQQHPQKPTRTHYTILEQIVKCIPPHLIANLAKKMNVDARKFSPKSHICSLILGQLLQSPSLNTICDTLKVHEADFNRLQGVSIPERNFFSRITSICSRWVSGTSRFHSSVWPYKYDA